MFQYLIVLLLLNFSYHSTGVPLPTNSPESMANLLTALANNCESVFLSDQIKSQIKYCSDLTSPRGGKQLECLLFYDINMQLCAAVGDSKIAIKEDYSAKIKEEQDVNTLCATANEWVFSNLTGYPRYQSSVEKVFKRLLACGKICSLDDLMSDDANYFCKYYKWGTDMLKQQVIPSIQDNLALLPADTVSTENKPVSVSNELQDVQIKNIVTSNGLVPKSEEVKIDETVKTEVTKPATTSENKVSEPSSPASEKSEPKAVVEEPVVNEQADKPAEITNDEVKNEGENRPDTTLTKPRVEPQKSEVDKDIQQLNNELEHKEPVLEMPGQTKVKEPNDAIDDYQDSEEVKDGLGDIQGGDDSDDPTIEDVNKVNKLDDVKEEKKETQNMRTIVTGITGESGLYPSFGQEGYSDDDDDHFFSFFLTAVIMVVLIYVLYHNKSKVAKVFFGLILEGRQAGRRRNSRGHAYRRLDTLEQAMSTNTAAPPSKIIY